MIGYGSARNTLHRGRDESVFMSRPLLKLSYAERRAGTPSPLSPCNLADRNPVTQMPAPNYTQ